MTEKNTTATPAASNGVIQTAVVENTHLSFSETGFANGYVGVPEKHPWFAKNYDDISCDCHGGLTYSENHLPNQRPDGFWWVGFDTCHSGDTKNRWPLSRVLEEVEDLRQQAEAVASNFVAGNKKVGQ